MFLKRASKKSVQKGVEVLLAEVEGDWALGYNPVFPRTLLFGLGPFTSHTHKSRVTVTREHNLRNLAAHSMILSQLIETVGPQVSQPPPRSGPLLGRH